MAAIKLNRTQLKVPDKSVSTAVTVVPQGVSLTMNGIPRLLSQHWIWYERNLIPKQYHRVVCVCYGVYSLFEISAMDMIRSYGEGLQQCSTDYQLRCPSILWENEQG